MHQVKLIRNICVKSDNNTNTCIDLLFLITNTDIKKILTALPTDLAAIIIDYLKFTVTIMKRLTRYTIAIDTDVLRPYTCEYKWIERKLFLEPTKKLENIIMSTKKNMYCYLSIDIRTYLFPKFIFSEKQYNQNLDDLFNKYDLGIIRNQISYFDQFKISLYDELSK